MRERPMRTPSPVFAVTQVSVSTDAASSESQSEEYVPTSSFTPINRPAPQLLTPQSSTFTPLSEQTQLANRGIHRERRRNPAVAEYLGLGAETEPPYLDKYAPALPPTPTTPPRGRKRSKRKRAGLDPEIVDAGHPKPAKQRRVSDGLRVTKPASRTSVKKSGTTSGTAISRHVSNSASASGNSDTHTPAKHSHEATESSVFPMQSTERGNASLSKSAAITQATPNVQQFSRATSSTTAHDAAFGRGPGGTHPVLELDCQDTLADDGIDDIFNLFELDDTTSSCTTDVQTRTNSASSQHQRVAVDAYYHLNNSDDYRADEDLFSLMAKPANYASFQVQPARPSEQPAIKNRSHATESIVHPEVAPPSSSRSLSRKFVSPVTQKTKAIIQKSVAGPKDDRKPIVRPPFPAPVRDRSPIIGLSSSLLLRTCFRIGEAINQACHAAKHGQKVMFELYARVLNSQRSEVRQDFVFRDLFHDKPPYIKGVYDAAIWKSVQLYDYDSGRLLTEHRMCRCVGTIKRDGKEWVMVVLNAWEAKWEDVAWVEGIVNTRARE
ncbi:hypothetical protein K458DRAFT_421220 [Lentithecium fluviatile CBS 122367]|uniref:Uncharacterized protein n=1 Tax=Lentithecium fluviatile CBS 122367 TaxID=1168545 RepID=A0A6G1ISN0_9PLEO|nr:hypothetical protein K458DRAFT_421220 [Lentithecium fluviatile CBS 122367]